MAHLIFKIRQFFVLGKCQDIEIGQGMEAAMNGDGTCNAVGIDTSLGFSGRCFRVQGRETDMAGDVFLSLHCSGHRLRQAAKFQSYF